jgi:hypothetical protein
MISGVSRVFTSSFSAGNGTGGDSFLGSGGTGGSGFINQDFLANPASVSTNFAVRSGNGFVQITEITPIPFAFTLLPGLALAWITGAARRRMRSTLKNN